MTVGHHRPEQWPGVLWYCRTCLWVTMATGMLCAAAGQEGVMLLNPSEVSQRGAQDMVDNRAEPTVLMGVCLLSPHDAVLMKT